jgi:hypothetical protein
MVKIIGKIELEEKNIPLTKKSTIEVNFYKDVNGKLIGRNEARQICFIAKGNQTTVRDGEVWNCNISEDKNNILFVLPAKLVRTKDQELAKMTEHLERLKQKYSK